MAKDNTENIDINSYMALHIWIRYHYGKATRCDNPNCSKTCRKFEWSLLKGRKYERNIENFWQLCKSCHVKYDMTDYQIEFNRKVALNNKWAVKPVSQFTLSGDHLKDYSSAREADKITGVGYKSISNNVNGRYKTAGGFVWRWAT